MHASTSKRENSRSSRCDRWKKRDNLVVMGCAPARSACDRPSRVRVPGAHLLTRSSTAALEAPARQTHALRTRGRPHRRANVAEIRSSSGRSASRWSRPPAEAGLVLLQSARLRGAEDLDAALRLVTRARLRCRASHRALASAGEWTEAATKPRPGRRPTRGRTPWRRSGDVGVATRDAASCSPSPSFRSRRSATIRDPAPRPDDPRVARLLDALTAAPLRRELGALGYDVRCSGDRVGDVRAA
jgi:hypothetical protein